MKPDGRSSTAIESVVIELAEIQAIIQELLEIALDLQNLLLRMSMLQIELPNASDEEDAESRKTDSTLAGYTANLTFNVSNMNALSIFAVDGRSRLESYVDEGARLLSHSMEITSTGLELERSISMANLVPWTVSKMASANTDAIYQLEEIYLKQKMNLDIFHEDLIKRRWAIKEMEKLRSILGEYSPEKEVFASSFQGEIGFSPLQRAIVQMEQQNKWLTGVNKIFEEGYGFFGLMADLTGAKAPAEEGLEPMIWHLEEMLSYRETMANISKYTGSTTDFQLTAKVAQEPLHIGHLKGSLNSALMPPESAAAEIDLEEPSQQMIEHRKIGQPGDEDRYREAFSLESIVEVPALFPRETKKITAKNIGRIHDAMAEEHNRREMLERKNVTSPNMSAAKPDDITRAFESLRNLIASVSETRGFTANIRDDADMAAPWNLAYQIMPQREMASAISTEFISKGLGAAATDGLFSNIMLGIELVDDLRRMASSATNEVALIVQPKEADRGSLVDWGPLAMNAVFNAISIYGTNDSSKTSGKSDVHIRNSFNIVVNVNRGSEELELRELGRKMGQILSEEIRRFGGLK